MPKYINNTFGKLVKITDLRTGLPYPDTDWRSFHIGRPGIIVVHESLRQMPGKTSSFFTMIRMCGIRI